MIDLGDFSIGILVQDDATSLHEMLLRNKERFQRFFPKTLAQNQNLEMTEEYISNKEILLVSAKEYTLGISSNATDEIVGLIIIKNINREIADAEVAYCLDKDYCGNGWMSKSVNKICDFAKDACNLETLFILAHKTNTSSVRVAEKTGFTWKETQLKSYTPVNETETLDMEKFVKTL